MTLISEPERRRLLAEAARDLLLLIERCPELFLHIVPIDEHDDNDEEEIAE